MREYIKTQPNSKARLIEFEAIQTVAEAKGAKYPLTKKWFLATFPEFKENEVSDAEIAAETEALAKAAATLAALEIEEEAA